MSKEKWSDAKTKSFITSYIKQTSLWNVSDPDYAIKAKKEKGYKTLQEEFDLTVNEVKNKIRIYRTTYCQELKKMETTNAFPKLSWFRELHKAFNQGKIKSFTKTPTRKSKNSATKEELIEIEYRDVTGEASDEEVEKMEDQEHYVGKKEGKQEKEDHQIIIEPYEEDYDEEEYRDDQTDPRTIVKTFNSSANISNNISCSSPPSTSTFAGNGMLSNELFLKSLQATLDRLPDAKNMRARIKIQEVLYKIAYEIDK